jgi:hypothetical protein
VDFCGFRLVAMPLLPVCSDTLVYGVDSLAAPGTPPRVSHTGVAAAMAAVGGALHLAPHLVRGVPLAAAADVEAHVGRDGRWCVRRLIVCGVCVRERVSECVHVRCACVCVPR